MIKKAIALSPFKTNFSPLFFSGDIENGISTAKNLGYDGVEISVNDPGKIDIKLIKSLLEETGLKVATIATGQAFVQDGLYFCSRDNEIRKKTVQRVIRQLEFGHQIGSEYLTIGGIRGKTNGDKVDAELSDMIGEAVYICCDHAKKLGMKILIEPVNHYEVGFLYTIRQSLEFIRKLNHEAVGLLYDTYHSNMEESSIVGALIECGKYLHHVHFADNNRLVPGYGCFNFTEVIRVLDRIGYDGYVCIEALPIPDSQTAAAQSITYLNAIINRGGVS